MLAVAYPMSHCIFRTEENLACLFFDEHGYNAMLKRHYYANESEHDRWAVLRLANITRLSLEPNKLNCLVHQPVNPHQVPQINEILFGFLDNTKYVQAPFRYRITFVHTGRDSDTDELLIAVAHLKMWLDSTLNEPDPRIHLSAQEDHCVDLVCCLSSKLYFIAGHGVQLPQPEEEFSAHIAVCLTATFRNEKLDEARDFKLEGVLQRYEIFLTYD